MEPGELSRICMDCACMMCRKDCLRCDTCGDRSVIECVEFQPPEVPA